MNAVAPTVWTKAGNNAFTTAFPGNINASGNIGRIVGANQSQGVATLAAKTKYSITYAEKNWGDAYGLRSAYVGNASGNFTFPDSAATSAFLGEAAQDANGIVKYDYGTKVAGAYTLGIISYMLIETEYADKARGAAVKQLAEYIVSPACSGADPKLGFVVISGTFLDKAKAQLAKMNK
jgi:phosphate transport system substrate-binding protein